jgi:hypothetical protein
VKFNHAIVQARSVSSIARVGAVLAMVGGALFFSGCSSLGSVSVRRDLDTIVAMAPAPVLVTKGSELRTAEAAASHLTGAQAFLGAGESMQPVYASGTAIVVTPCDFSELRPGMSVVYVNHDGRGVAHALVGKARDGWIAQGVNNPEQDTDLVTAGNLVGVITQAYASSDTPMRREIADRAMLKMASGAKAQVALALSKAGSTNAVLAWQ